MGKVGRPKNGTVSQRGPGRPKKGTVAQRGPGRPKNGTVSQRGPGRPKKGTVAHRGRARKITEELIDKSKTATAAKRGRSMKVEKNDDDLIKTKQPFVCGLCDEKFEQMYIFFQHFSKHEGLVKQSQLHKCMPYNREKYTTCNRTEECFKCGVCSEEFPNLCLLHEHLKHPSNGSYSMNLSSLTASPDSNQCLHGDAGSHVNGTDCTNEIDHDDSSDLDVHEEVDEQDIESSDDEKEELTETNNQKDTVRDLGCKVKEEFAMNLKECFVRLKQTPLLNNIKKEDPDAGTVCTDVAQPPARSTRKKRVKYDQFLVDSGDEDVIPLKNVYKKRRADSPDNDYIPGDDCEPTEYSHNTDTDEAKSSKPKHVSLKKLFSFNYVDKNSTDLFLKDNFTFPILSRKTFYPCKVCGLLVQKNRLLIHEGYHQTKKGKILYDPSKMQECPECNRKMLIKNASLHKCQYLRVHDRESFGQKKVKAEPKIKVQKRKLDYNRKMPCDVCGVLVKRYSMKTHALRHMDDRPYPCDVCGKAFKILKEVQKHIAVVHGEKMFQCDRCPKAFTTNHMLQEHAMIHTDERPFPCPTCGLRFRRKGQRRTHMLVHTGKPEQRCDLCGKLFLRKTSLREHIAVVHNQIKNWVCNISGCEKRFRSGCGLRRHQLTHTGEKPVKCDHCEAGFTQRTELKIHLKSKHGILELPPSEFTIQRRISMFGLAAKATTDSLAPSTTSTETTAESSYTNTERVIPKTEQTSASIEHCIPNTEQTLASIEHCIPNTEQTLASIEHCIPNTEQTLASHATNTAPSCSSIISCEPTLVSSSMGTEPCPTPSTTNADHMTVESRLSPLFQMHPESVSNVVKAITPPYPIQDLSLNYLEQDASRVVSNYGVNGQTTFYPVQDEPLQRLDGYAMMTDEMKVEPVTSPVHEVQLHYPQQHGGTTH